MNSSAAVSTKVVGEKLSGSSMVMCKDFPNLLSGKRLEPARKN